MSASLHETSLLAAFPAYLRGIEMRERQYDYPSDYPFPAYLRGIEMPPPRPAWQAAGRFPAYLRGIEIYTRGAWKSGVPSFQPTYEGLKSEQLKAKAKELSRFPAYLRGIEIVYGATCG